jgi:fucose permease
MGSTSTATVEVQLETITRKFHQDHIHVEDRSNETTNYVVQEEAFLQPVQDEPTTIDRPLALKLVSAGFSFFLAGINDGSLGTLIPYFRQTYNIGFSATTIM